MAGLADSLAQAPNPFACVTVGDLAADADGDVQGDVESIHQEVRATLREVAGRTLGGRGHLLVLTGVSGAGRSHLLWWLRQAERGALLCVPVSLPVSADEPGRHVLRHIIKAMQAQVTVQAGAPSEATPVPGAPDTYLARLVWEVLYAQVCDLLDAARSGQYQAPAAQVRQLALLCEQADEAPRPALGFAVAAAPHWQRLEPEIRKYMLTLPQDGPADAAVRAVLCQYPYEDRRALCASFLGGEVPGEADLRRLAVALPPGGVQALRGEAVARRLLGWVCRVAPTPMLLLYDQRGDGPPAGDPKGLRALADVLGEVGQHGGRTGQVLACTQSLWATLHPLVTEKLRGKPRVVPLQALPPDHVRELVLLRLRQLESGSRLPPRPQPFYPFTEDEVLAESWSAGQQTVRETLQHFSARYVERLAKLREPAPAVAPRQAPVAAPPKTVSQPPRLAPVVVPAVAAPVPIAQRPSPVAPVTVSQQPRSVPITQPPRPAVVVQPAVAPPVVAPPVVAPGTVSQPPRPAAPVAAPVVAAPVVAAPVVAPLGVAPPVVVPVSVTQQLKPAQPVVRPVAAQPVVVQPVVAQPVVVQPVVVQPVVAQPVVAQPVVVPQPVIEPPRPAPPVVVPLPPAKLEPQPRADSLPPPPAMPAAPATAPGLLEAAYQRALLDARGTLGAGQPGARAATLRTAIKELCDGLRGIPGGLSGVQVMGCEPILGGGLRLVLQQPGEPQRSIRCALEICNTEMGPAVYGATARLARQVSDGRAEAALLLREERLSAARGPGGAAADAALVAQLGPSGGVLWLSDEATVELLAAERVLALCGSGELHVGARSVSRAEGLGLLLRRQGGPPQGLRQLIGRVSPVAGEALAPDRALRLPQAASEAAGAAEAQPGPRTRQTMTGLTAIVAGPGKPAAAPAPRRTLSRMAAISVTTPTEGTAAEILEIIGERAMVEEGLLAKELGLSEDMMPRLIAPLEQQGAIRVTTSVQGRRILIKVPR